MKKLLAVSCSLLATVVVAAEFPYATEMTVRNEKASAEVASFENPVEIPAVGEGMPMTDSVATLYAAVVDFCASDEENWTNGVPVISSLPWFGYTLL